MEPGALVARVKSDGMAIGMVVEVVVVSDSGDAVTVCFNDCDVRSDCWTDYTAVPRLNLKCLTCRQSEPCEEIRRLSSMNAEILSRR